MHLVPMTALVNKSGAKHNDDLSQEVLKDSREESDKTSICQNKLLVHHFTNSHMFIKNALQRVQGNIQAGSYALTPNDFAEGFQFGRCFKMG